MLEIRELTLSFGETKALRGVDLTVDKGSVVALTGPSGCGKSTLLHLMAGLLKPDSGTVRVGDLELSAASDKARSRWRLHNCGFVFQLGELVPELSLADNVALPLTGRMPEAEIRTRVSETMAALEIDAMAERMPSEVSGGQAQRAAVGRALVHNPSVVLADEPTGSLDQANGTAVLELLLHAAAERGATVVLASHDRALADAADTEIRMLDGQVQQRVRG